MATKIERNTRKVETKVANKANTKATPAKAAKVEKVVLTASGKPVVIEKVSINPAAKIKAVGENPYRKGSKKAIAFGKFKVGQTCEAAIEACGDADRLRWAIKREYVKVAA